MTDPTSPFGDRLRGLRRAAGLTMEQLAEASGVSARAISDMERGHSRAPQVRTLAALADGLRLTDHERAGLEAAARQARSPSAAGRPRLCELPRGVTDFVGRVGDLVVARETARQVGGGAPPPVLVVHGQPGLGKTAFAVRVAEDLRDAFPDGALYLDLRGTDPVPLPVGEALIRLLRALDVGSRQIAGSDDERSAQLRGMFRDRRCLLILDNAGSEAQVRPLLPAAGGCLVVVTSRRTLGGLEGVQRIGLTPLAPGESARLLGAIAAQAVDSAATGQVETVARLCGHLPLALRIAGTRLASRPQWTVGHLVDRLADADRRLAALAAGDTAVAAAFALSHAQLSVAAATVFRRLAHVPGADFAAPLAAVLTETAAPEAEDLLDELVELGLLQPVDADRYRFHDLIRLYADERLRIEEPPANRAVTHRRMTDWLLETAIVAGRWHEPGYGALPDGWAGLVPLATLDEAGSWLRAEAGNWLPALRTAAADGRHQLVVDLAEAMHWYSDASSRWPGWYEVYGLSRTAAAALPDRRQQAVHLNYYAWAAAWSGQRFDESAEVAMEAFRLAEAIENLQEQAWALQYAGTAWRSLNRLDDALWAGRKSLDLADQVGNHDGYVQHIIGVALTLARQGRYDEAIDEHQRALAELERRPVSPRPALVARVNALVYAAYACCLAGRWEEALRTAELALSPTTELGAPRMLGSAHLAIGQACAALGRTAEARPHLVRGLDLGGGAVLKELEEAARATLAGLDADDSA
ncbi:XRE family transcriptional regulator [Plantactinospora mayteni]|uniref:HTH cro/C1-type domain-containing protein n=1 Tax=Plantactinospora mayteni TaxID=566021 RepID=A0ABQ4F049_9ACTN|nr:helix-turn-helix domain-containing protein [Plantactinospora mayteni]GIH00257.1 hypothetical protein Pma05_68290 [Plantactinospora mayteni]